MVFPSQRQPLCSSGGATTCAFYSHGTLCVTQPQFQCSTSCVSVRVSVPVRIGWVVAMVAVLRTAHDDAQVSQLEFMVFMLQEMRLATAEDVDRILGIFHSRAHPSYFVLFCVCFC